MRRCLTEGGVGGQRSGGAAAAGSSESESWLSERGLRRCAGASCAAKRAASINGAKGAWCGGINY